jgi:hypothetical protein
LETPGTAVKAFFTVMGQTGQVMDGTSSVTVLVAARAGITAASIRRADSLLAIFMGYSL